MLRCFEALNPLHWCFTASNFDDYLLTIDGLLRNYETSMGDPTAIFGRAEKKQQLEKAYRLALVCLEASPKHKPDKQLVFLMGDILRQYATVCYAENFLESKQLLLAAFNMHLYAIDLLDKCFDMQEFCSLDELKTQLKSKPHLFDAVEDLILTTHTERCISAALTSILAQAYPSRRLYNLADTARRLGCCYQHLDSYCAAGTSNDQRFGQLFNLSEALLLLIDDARSRRELGDLYCQAFPFIYQRQHPEAVDELCDRYKKALIYDSSPAMQARAASLSYLCLFKAGRKSEAYVCIKQAVDATKQLADHEANRLLIAEVHHHYAGYFMDQATVDLPQAEAALAVSLRHAAMCRRVGDDHLYFAAYDLRLAELKLVMGAYAEAKDAVDSGIRTLKKFPESQQPFIGQAEALQAIIADVMKYGLKILM